MSFDVYFKQDILNILRSTYAASEGSASLVLEMLEDPDLQGVPVGKLLHIYRRGFATALGAVGLAFGLDATLPGSGTASCPLLSDPQQDAFDPGAQQAEWTDAQVLGFLWQTVNQVNCR